MTFNPTLVSWLVLYHFYYKIQGPNPISNIIELPKLLIENLPAVPTF